MQIDIKRICVPTDFSECGDHAVTYGAALARMFGADLHIVHVLQDVTEKMRHPDFTSTGATVSEFVKALEDGATQYLARLIADKEWRGLNVERLFLYGPPAEQIARYAKKNSIDLLVVGTHGRTGLSHLLAGSVAERVVRISPCPVLTVRHGADRDFVHQEDQSLPGVE